MYERVIREATQADDLRSYLTAVRYHCGDLRVRLLACAE